ncbi:hypothetical protein L228DRAFT_221249 [Xylona heveae TC161]|uniref:FK506-binding protein n=1 Tax=Xylona heveae (strain CBS 132557 / TC161) TaxID=1328760 RepID=A0A165GML5_XYLHT|nr:hypothetical protein L228DRAFT_221249 [Xylona heveae TC161]KZF22376.1 hypothetical protein L228DRAFT_221249 [Xylona heveae TC161]
MSGMLPVAVYGLEVPAGDVIIPAVPDFPATFRITMAAIDPSAPAQNDAANGNATPRATLKIIRQAIDAEDEDDEDDEDEEYLRRLIGGSDSEEEESSDEEANGGPSDPSKSKKARKEAAVEALKKALAEQDAMEVDGEAKKSTKGKGKASEEEESDEESDEEDDEEGEDLEIEEFVICTLDPAKHYQQPLDITIGEGERCFFKVSGTHTVFLTGNYVVPAGDDHHHDDEEDEEDEDYDLSPDEDELDDEYDEDEESDELDTLENPRISEVASEDEEVAPKLVEASKADKKGKNKRAAEETATLDAAIAKDQKKQKNNAGKAIEKKEEKAKESPAGKGDKKVQFAKNLEQGPTGSAAKEEKAKATTGVKTVQGVKIDDKKLGSGPASKKGDKVSMRYIGKFQDGKVFDANKKGKPFTFTLGKGEVIKGWDIGVAGMSVGGERRIVIPSNLAYGSRPPPGMPPNAALTFDIKMLEIK